MIITVRSGQSLIDLAVQYYGSASAIVDLANDNGLALDTEVQPGQELLIRDEYPESGTPIFADYIKESNIIIVSGELVNALEVLVTDDEEVLTDNDGNGFEI